MNAWGIDISSHKCDYFGGPPPRLDLVKGSGCSFVISKATDGENFVDSIWGYVQEETRKNNMVLGGYHFWQPVLDPIKQAKNFRAHYDFKAGDMPPIVDVEEENGAGHPNALDNLMLHLKAVEEEFGIKPMVYTGVAYWNRLNLGAPPEWCKEYELWLSLPNGGDNPNLFPIGWDNKWRIWQCSWEGKVPGVQGGTGDVDMNWYNGSESDLYNWIAEVNPTKSQRVAKLFRQGKIGEAIRVYAQLDQFIGG